MAGQSICVPISEPTEISRPSCPATDQMVASVLKDVAIALWPENAAANLAAEVGCSIRTIERYFEGSREWSGDAIAAIVNEIFRRHAKRHLRAVAR